MNDLAEFLLARFAEDEDEARAIDDGFDWDLPRAKGPSTSAVPSKAETA